MARLAARWLADPPSANVRSDVMERARTSEWSAFEAAFTADGSAFQGHDGQVIVNDPEHAPAPSIVIRRRRPDTNGESVSVLITIASDRPGLLAVSVTETDYSSEGTARQSQVHLAPVFRSPNGGFHIETHVGRLVAEGEFTTYFWTLAGYRLGVDE
jgi:hypothetical protein